MSTLRVGAANVEITPRDSQFLFGYPHVERYSQGVHDPLFASAIFFGSADSGGAVFVANDLIFVDKNIAGEARKRISISTGVPEEAILISATHTHSAPITVEHASNRDDPVVPKPDAEYRTFLIECMGEAGRRAVENAVPAQLGFSVAHAAGVGGNRRDPSGPKDSEVPIIVARDHRENMLGCMVVYSVHPTVLHEDSKLISGDFPAFTRTYLQQQVLGTNVPVVYHTGPAGNQSPRHVARENTFAEAERLGSLLGEAIEYALGNLSWVDSCDVEARHTAVDLPRNSFPSPDEARRRRDMAVQRLQSLQREGAPRQESRTAETDWFGATEVMALAEAQADGVLEEFYSRCLPAEIQAIRIGPYVLVGWPGELFVEYGLNLKQRAYNAYGISLANGELQGYVVTEEAAKEGGYEASNALFHWKSGPILVDTAIALIEELRRS